MHAADVKASRIPHCSAPPSPRPPKKAAALSSHCSRSHPGYIVQNIMCFFVPQADFAFVFLHLATINTHIPSSY